MSTRPPARLERRTGPEMRVVRHEPFVRQRAGARLRPQPSERPGQTVADAPDVDAGSLPGQRTAPLGAGSGEPAGPELLSLLQAGDEAAFARIVDAWSPAMLRLARAHVSTYASAQEVVQDTWLA